MRTQTQGEDSGLHAKERGLGKNQPCPHLGLDFQPPGRGDHVLFKPLGL